MRRYIQPPETGVFVECKRCRILKDECLFKYQGGKRVGLLCRECSNKEKKDGYVRRERKPPKHSNQTERMKAWFRENKQNHNAKCKMYAANNKERLAKLASEYYESNKAEFKKRMQQWREANPGMVTHYSRLYTLGKERRTPLWANIEAIKAFYRNCPKGYAVDHMIPLHGKNVCGLHVETNLQYLTKSENSRKGRRWNPEQSLNAN